MASIFKIYMLGTWPENNYADADVGEAGTEAAALDRLKIIAKEHYDLPEDQFYVQEEEL
jgi:S-adenosylmethionine/arginine decarboxylase-like enzyme